MVAPTGLGDTREAAGRGVTYVQSHSKMRNIKQFRRLPRPGQDRIELDFQ